MTIFLRLARRCRTLAATAGALLVCASAFAQAPLTQLQFDIVGVRLVVDPPALTVPKNIATQINTTLALRPNAGSNTRDAISALTDGAVIEAELRGPDLPRTRIVTRPGQPIPIPPLAIPGDYVLDGVRLVKDGRTLLDATSQDGRLATTIPIHVISEVFVTNVTSRPLSLDEIRGKGIVIDQNNFRAVNFQVAFNIDGAPFTIDVPAALPTPEFLAQRPTRAQIIEQLTATNQALRAIETRLPPQFDRPGLNFSIAALPFFPVLQDDGGVPPLDIPPITGLVVIPGNVAFLNQFFSVLLMVTNVAPDGTPLVLRDTSATIVLPTGADHVAGTFTSPGDDPLRLARVEGVGIQATVPVIQLGPDGLRGTGDDVAFIPPQRSGEGEFLVEGLKEGSHQFDLEIHATLFGLPSGPVELMGQAAGAVFVRNPTFSVTLAHPRTIRTGERYDLYATVTNTSQTAANLVTVGLEPRAIVGAQLSSDPRVTFDTIPPGQAVTAKFTLVAQKTGEVTFSSFTGDAASGGGIQLTTGVDERGVALAPNAIVLPKSADRLPSTLLVAAQRVLGQAFSIATAPAEALPAGVVYVKRQTVIDRGIDLAESGERIDFGEPLGRVIQDLLLDWLGNGSVDAGFDQLLRTTEAGAAFLSEIAAIIQHDAPGPVVVEYQRDFARTVAGRAPHLSAVVGGGAGLPAPLMSLSRASGGTVGQSSSGLERTLVSAGALDLVNVGGDARLIVVAAPETDRYRLQVVARAAASYDLGLVIPGAAAGQLVQLRYPNVQLDAGGTARLDIDLTAAGAATLDIDRSGDGSIDTHIAPQQTVVVEDAPTLVGVRQLVSSYRESGGDVSDPATYGLVLGALFNKPVDVASAELKSHYTIDSNAVIGARLQSSGRVVYLYLERPVGALVARSLTVSGVADAHGLLSGVVTTPIVMALNDGGRVFGQVRTADGHGVPASVLRLTVEQFPFSFDVSTIRTDTNGSFDFDFVPRFGNVVLTGQHPATLEIATLTARIRGQGEQLLLNPTFQGRGTVRGRVLAADGVTAVANAQVALLPGSITSNRGFETRTDALGEFTFDNAPVGVFTLSAADTSGGFGQTTSVLSSGQITAVDIVLTARTDNGGRIVGRVFLEDGATPGAGFIVYVGTYNRGTAAISAVDRTIADATGTFTFARTLPPGSYDVVAVDPASHQLGATRAGVLARQTTSISIVLEATGAVEGVVFNARGEPLAGALVAGGVALVQTNANGFFRLDGVPAGRRTIEAGDPVTRRRGSAEVTVLAGQTISAAVTLEARATITGRVLDSNGAPVPRATVRLPVVGGYTFVFANDSGVYRFPDLPLGEHLIQAPGPSRESLISFMKANGIDPRTAFTAGDIPADLGGVPAISVGDTNAILAAYQDALRTFFNIDESSLVGLPMADVGGFGWNRVRLFQDSTTAVADIKFLAKGTVGGRTVDADNRPTGALTRITGLAVSLTGFPTIAELGRITTNAATGVFSFAGIPRFDLSMFQTAGVRGGDFTLEAATPFSPVIAQLRGQLNTTTPNLSDLVLRFPAATETNGTIKGRVLLPGGAPAPANTQVHISFGDLSVLTDGDGRFESTLPIPSASYAVTAIAPNGLRGQTHALVPAGGAVDVIVQLLGLGATTIIVTRPNGQVVPQAAVTLERGSFPNDRVNGIADANGRVRFINISEGAYSVNAEEPITGLGGRASGTIVRDADIPTAIVITASGRVTGRFITADTGAPIPFAQVVLSTGNVRAFTTTDAAGLFELLAVPIGRFTIEASDPSSGRIGRASDDLSFEGQRVDVTVVQVARGTVAGVVLQADGSTAVPGASVHLRSGAVLQTDLQATARPDGSFRFDGIPAGDFTLIARDPVSGFEGTGTGRVTFENERVDRNVLLAPFGVVRVTVRDVAGQLAPNATVVISRGSDFSKTAAVDASGLASFEFVPPGEYQIVARSLSNPGDGGHTTATVPPSGGAVDVNVTFRGTGSVGVTVVGSDGVTRIPSARVTLNATAAAPGSAPGPLATTVTGFTNSSGLLTFENVQVGAFFVTGEFAALGGMSNGALGSPGATTDVTIQLGASGSVAGRVLLPDGITPAVQAVVTLRFAPQSTLQTGTVQVTTSLTGQFEFTGVPVGNVTISAIEVVTSGVRSITGTLSTNGQRLDLGDIVLDNTHPTVATIDPADRSTGVTLQPAIVVTFSEPMNPGSFSGNVRLMDGSTSVAVAALTFSNDHRSITIRPTQPLRSTGAYAVTVRGGPDGPRDEAADLPLLDSFVSTFTTVDNIPPTVVSVTPAQSARQVALESSVRVQFSEPVAAATLSLRDGQGATVPGQTTLTAGNTAVAFAPLDFLKANTSYTATLSGAVDNGGNPVVGGTQSFAFDTLDTIAPVITSLQLSATPKAGGQVTITPVITGNDVDRVELVVGTNAAVVAATAPFAITTVLPNASTVTLNATAFDAVGNRSSTFTQQVALQTNQPPTVAVRTVLPITRVGQGQTVEFEASATDDDRLARVALSAVGAASFTDTREVQSGQSAFTTRFSVQIPATAATGATLTVQAVAFDAAGVPSQPASLTLPVADGRAPTVSVLTPVNNAQVVAGAPLTVTLDTADDVGVTSVTLTCVPALVGCEARALDPAAATSRQTFTVQVPANATAASSIVLVASATDAAGNTGQTGRTVFIPDTVSPAATALETVSGSSSVTPGETVSLRATVSDNVGVTALAFETEGVLTTTGSQAVSPAIVSGSTIFSLAIPTSTPSGTMTVRVRARDAAGNLSDAASVTLTVAIAPIVRILSPAAGGQIDPRSPLSVTVEATHPVGVAQVSFSATGVVTTSESRTISPTATTRTETFTLTISPPATGGLLNLNASARDSAGNTGTAVGLSVEVQDVVPPTVTSAAPAGGATNVPVSATITLTFSEPMSRATLSTATVRLSAGGAAVPTTLLIASDDRSATLTPAAPLAINTVFTVTVEGAVTDRANNPLGTAFVSTFRTTSPDTTAPRIVSIDPADNATGVPTTTPVTVTFTEPIDPASVTTASFRVRVGGAPVAGTFAFLDSNRVARFTPAAPWPFETIVVTELTGGIVDASGNALVATDGQPIASPLTFTFLTGNFAITSPATSTVVERTTITLAAAAGASLNVTSVVFSVNGVALPAVTSAPFSTSFAVPARANVPTLSIVASARDGANSEVARAEKSLTVVDGLTVTPSILGLPRGAVRTLRFSIASPATEDVTIAVTTADALVATVSPPQLTIAAGQTSTTGTVTACTACPGDPAPAGRAVGNTSVLATSPRGTAAAVISVSDLVIGQELTPLSPAVGTSITLPPSAGHAFVNPNGRSTLAVTLLAQPLAGNTPIAVSVTSSRPDIVTAAASELEPGQRTVLLTLEAHGVGIAVLTLRVGNEVRSFTVFVGPPPPDVVPLVSSAPVGVSISLPPSAGQVLTSAGRTSTVTIQVLAEPLAGTTPLGVQVTSSNPAVATATATAIAPGSRVTSVTITTLADGFVSFTIRAGTEVRSLGVFVGPPPPDATPLVIATPIGVSIVLPPSAGQVLTSAGRVATITAQILSTPNAGTSPLAVEVTSSSPAVATATATAVQPGSRVTTITITAIADGVVSLTLRVGNDVRSLGVFVGPPPANATPLVLAVPIGVSVVALSDLGRVVATPGAPVTATLGIQLLTAARSTPTTVSISSTNPSVAMLASGTTGTTTVATGELTASVPLVTTGVGGFAILRFTIDGVTRELLVIVGDPPLSERPAVTAPVIGVRVGG